MQRITFKKTVRLIIPEDVYEKQRFLCQKSPTKEWSGLLLYEMQGSINDLDSILLIAKDIIPFTVGLASHFNMIMEKPEKSPEFFKTVAEFAFIHSLLAQTRYQWHPSTSAGPQFGEWRTHEKLLKCFAAVARNNKNKE